MHVVTFNFTWLYAPFILRPCFKPERSRIAPPHPPHPAAEDIPLLCFYFFINFECIISSDAGQFGAVSGVPVWSPWLWWGCYRDRRARGGRKGRGRVWVGEGGREGERGVTSQHDLQPRTALTKVQRWPRRRSLSVKQGAAGSCARFGSPPAAEIRPCTFWWFFSK